MTVVDIGEPRPGTQKAVVLEALRRAAGWRGVITARYANFRLGIGQLPMRIVELRRDHGVSIDREMVHVSSRWEGGSSVAAYYLEGFRPKDIRAAVGALGNGGPPPGQRMLALTTVHCPRCGGAIASDQVREGRGRYMVEAHCTHCEETWAARVIAGTVCAVETLSSIH